MLGSLLPGKKRVFRAVVRQDINMSC